MNSTYISSYKKTADLYQSLKLLKASVFWQCNFLPYLRYDNFLLEKAGLCWFSKTLCWNWKYSKFEAGFILKQRPWKGGRGGDTHLHPPTTFPHQHQFLSITKKEQHTKNGIREATLNSWQTKEQLSYDLWTLAKSLSPTIISQTTTWIKGQKSKCSLVFSLFFLWICIWEPPF